MCFVQLKVYLCDVCVCVCVSVHVLCVCVCCVSVCVCCVSECVLCVLLDNMQLCKINVVSSWQKAQLLASHDARMAELEGEVDRVKRELTETKVAAKEEKRLLRQQVETLQKVSALCVLCACVRVHVRMCVAVEYVFGRGLCCSCECMYMSVGVGEGVCFCVSEWAETMRVS